jgi:hypothetical protein
MKKCNHPKESFNLINGECGTCRMAKEFENTAKEFPDDSVSKILLGLAGLFKSGKIIYDTRGKSLLEWDKHFNKPKPKEWYEKNIGEEGEIGAGNPNFPNHP